MIGWKPAYFAALHGDPVVIQAAVAPQADGVIESQRQHRPKGTMIFYLSNVSEMGHLRNFVSWDCYEPQNERITVSLAVI